MTVRVRLQRFGRRNRPFYRVVVADSRSPRNGKFIELVSVLVCVFREIWFVCCSLRLPAWRSSSGRGRPNRAHVCGAPWWGCNRSAHHAFGLRLPLCYSICSCSVQIHFSICRLMYSDVRHRYSSTLRGSSTTLLCRVCGVGTRLPEPSSCMRESKHDSVPRRSSDDVNSSRADSNVGTSMNSCTLDEHAIRLKYEHVRMTARSCQLCLQRAGQFDQYKDSTAVLLLLSRSCRDRPLS